MPSSLSKRAINRQRWFTHIQAWEQSELTQKAYCEQHHLGQAAFHRWRRIFKREDKAAVSPAGMEPVAVNFLPVNVLETRAAKLTVLIDERVRLDIIEGFDAALLRQVVRALQA